MLVMDGSIGTDQTIDLVSKNIGERFNFNQSAEAILQQTTDFEIQKVQPDWFDLTKNSALKNSNQSKYGELSTLTVMEALRKSL